MDEGKLYLFHKQRQQSAVQGDDVSLHAINEVRRQFIFESAVAIRAFAEIVAIEPNLAVAIDAVKLDKDQFAFGSCGNGERLAIPAEAAGQRATAGAGGILFAKTAFDTPVVWQV